MLAGGSTSGTLATGRSVVTHSNSIYLSSAFSRDTATIRTAGKTIVVRPTCLLVDGVQVADIDEAAASIEVRMNRRKISVVADGKLLKLP